MTLLMLLILQWCWHKSCCRNFYWDEFLPYRGWLRSLHFNIITYGYIVVVIVVEGLAFSCTIFIIKVIINRIFTKIISFIKHSFMNSFTFPYIKYTNASYSPLFDSIVVSQWTLLCNMSSKIVSAFLLTISRKSSFLVRESLISFNINASVDKDFSVYWFCPSGVSFLFTDLSS